MKLESFYRNLSSQSTFSIHYFWSLLVRGYSNPKLFRGGSEMQNLIHLVKLTEEELRSMFIAEVVGVLSLLYGSHLEANNEVWQRYDGDSASAIITPLQR